MAFPLRLAIGSRFLSRGLLIRVLCFGAEQGAKPLRCEYEARCNYNISNDNKQIPL